MNVFELSSSIKLDLGSFEQGMSKAQQMMNQLKASIDSMSNIAIKINTGGITSTIELVRKQIESIKNSANGIEAQATVSVEVDTSQGVEAVEKLGEAVEEVKQDIAEMESQASVDVDTSQGTEAVEKLDDALEGVKEEAIALGDTDISVDTSNTVVAVAKLDDEVADLGTQADNTANSMERLGNAGGGSFGRNLVSGLRSVISGVTKAAAIAKTAMSAIETYGIAYNAKIEGYAANFKTLLGDAEKAATRLDELRVMAAKTPFELSDLTSATQTLLSFQVAADETNNVLQMLGDISLGDANKLSALSLVFGQISSAGKLSGQDLLQCINVGFNPLNYIAERTGESMEDLRKRMSDGKVGIDEVKQALVDATSEGGAFFNGMETASKTFSGQLSTLKDDATALLGEMTEGLFEDVKGKLLPGAQSILTELTDAFHATGTEGVINSISSLIERGLSMAAANSASIGQGVGRIIKTIGTSLVKGIPDLAKTAVNIVSNIAGEVAYALPDIILGLGESLVGLAANLLPSIGQFVGKITDGLARGLGIIPDTIENRINKILSSVDTKKVLEFETEFIETQKRVKNIIEHYNVSTTVTTSDVQVDVDAIYASIIAQLSEGKEVTPEDAAAVNKAINDYANAALTAVDVDTSGKIAELNDKLKKGLITKDDYDKQVAEVLASAEEAKAKLLALVSTSTDTVNGLVGQSTVTLETAKGQLTQLSAGVAEAVTAIGLSTSALTLANVYETVKTAFTDGKADTAEVIETAKGNITGALDEMSAGITASADAAKSALDTTAADYDTKVAEIDAKAKDYEARRQALEKGMSAWIDAMAGQSTAYVAAHLGELQAYIEEAQKLQTEINQLTSEQVEGYKSDVDYVKSGATKDKQTIDNAFSYTYETKEAAMRKAAAERQKEIDAAHDRNKGNHEQNKLDEAQINADFEAKKAEILAIYTEELNALQQGLLQAFGENSSELEGASDAFQNEDMLNKLLTSYMEAAKNGEGIELDDGTAQWLSDQFKSKLGEVFQLSPEDIQKIFSGDATVGEGLTLSSAIASLITGFAEDSEAVNKLAEKDNPFTEIFQELINRGIWDGIDGVDITQGNAKALAMIGKLDVKTPLETAGSEGGESLDKGLASGIETSANFAVDAADSVVMRINKSLAKLNKTYTLTLSVNGGGSGSGDSGTSHGGGGGAFNVEEHALGGVFTQPTLLYGRESLHGVGEAGAEAILPLNTLWAEMDRRLTAAMAMNGAAIDYDALTEAVAARPVKLSVGARELADSTADDNARSLGAVHRRVAFGYGGK